jgi:hypothetical protein
MNARNNRLRPYFISDFIRDNAIEVTNKHAPKWGTKLPRIQDYILSTTYDMLPLLTFKFPEDRDVTAEDIQPFFQHQKMAMIAASGFNVSYELIGNLRKADWYNQVRKIYRSITVCIMRVGL